MWIKRRKFYLCLELTHTVFQTLPLGTLKLKHFMPHFWAVLVRVKSIEPACFIFYHFSAIKFLLSNANKIFHGY